MTRDAPIRLGYARRCRLVLQHGYFGEGPCPAAGLVAPRSGAAMIAALGGRLRSGPGQVELWGPLTAQAADPGPDRALHLYVVTDDPTFSQYTACDADQPPAHTVQLLSGPGAQKPRGVRAVEHSGSLTLSDEQTGAQLAVRDLTNQATVATLPTPEGPFSTVQLAPFDLTVGRYALVLDGTDLAEFVLLDRPVTQVWGVWEASAAQLANAWQTQQDMTADLQGVMARWAWHILGTAPANGFADWTMQDGAGRRVAMTGPVASNHLGRACWSATLSEPHMITATGGADTRLSLVPPAALVDIERPIVLPRPGPQHLRMSDGQGLVADMVVYR